MRYKVILKQYKEPNHLVIRLDDGRVLRGPVTQFPKRLAVGDTGNVREAKNRLQFVPDAIELEWVAV